jgi:hypothetical protein
MRGFAGGGHEIPDIGERVLDWRRDRRLSHAYLPKHRFVPGRSARSDHWRGRSGRARGRRCVVWHDAREALAAVLSNIST